MIFGVSLRILKACTPCLWFSLISFFSNIFSSFSIFAICFFTIFLFYFLIWWLFINFHRFMLSLVFHVIFYLEINRKILRSHVMFPLLLLFEYTPMTISLYFLNFVINYSIERFKVSQIECLQLCFLIFSYSFKCHMSFAIKSQIFPIVVILSFFNFQNVFSLFSSFLFVFLLFFHYIFPLFLSYTFVPFGISHRVCCFYELQWFE